MKRFKKLVLAAALLLFGGVAVAATYTQTLLTDGTNLWTLVSTNNGAVSQAQVQENGVTVMTIDPVSGIMPVAGLVAALPACTSTNKGALRVVTDASSPTYGGSLTGSSTTYALALCNGTAWFAH
jgi:ABC-type amino acid transport substrate-binding protein